MSDQTPEVPETGVPAVAPEAVTEAVASAAEAAPEAVAEDAAPDAVRAVEPAVPDAAAEGAMPDAVRAVEPAVPEAAPPVGEAVVPAPAAPGGDGPPPPPPGAVAPPPGYAPVVATVPVFPDGKPMLDAQGQPVSDKSRLAAALLCWFVGVLGVHRFYVGKVGTGVAMLLTCGGLGVWALIDLIVILLGTFKDASGRNLQNW